jgi:hypothetical protein
VGKSGVYQHKAVFIVLLSVQEATV